MITPSKGDKKEYKRWEKSIKANNVEKTMCVEEAENGFVIRISEYNYGSDFKENKKVYISQTNPLEKEQVSDTTSEADIMKAVEEFNELFN